MSRALVELQLLRIKTVFGLREDQEVARLLGIARTSLSVYKARGRLPEALLDKLAQQSEDMARRVALVRGAPGTPEQPAYEGLSEEEWGKLNLTVAQVHESARLGIKPERVKRYAEIIRALDLASEDSVFHVWWIAQRLARADGVDASLLPRGAAGDAEPQQGDPDVTGASGSDTLHSAAAVPRRATVRKPS